MQERFGYVVEVYTRRHPDSFRGPKFFRKLASFLSEELNAQTGGGLGMPLEEAERIADERTHTEGYIPLSGNLTTSQGVAKQVGY